MLLDVQDKHIVQKTILINIIIIFLFMFSSYSMDISFLGGIIIIFYLSVKAAVKPVEAILMIFGIKLTFDSLWIVKPESYGSDMFNLLEIYCFPIVILSILSIRHIKRREFWPLFFTFIYLLWATLAMTFNGVNIDGPLLIRQSGMLFGFLIGLAYIKKEKHFDTVVFLLFISTLIPVLASLLQVLCGQADIQILNFKHSAIRGFRYSGFYYDPGSSGMVSIVSIFACAYLISSDKVGLKLRKILYGFIGCNIFLIIVGGTRSMIVAAFIILIVFFYKYKRIAIRFMPLALIVALLSQPYIEKAAYKTTKEIYKPIKVSELMQETDYRTMFTGRVGKWQEIWRKIKKGSAWQICFGHGLSSNAHSSYFFLLLHIGWLGLIYYLLFQFMVLYKISMMKVTTALKMTSMLAIVSVLVIGISLTVVLYTSFQWIAYLILGAAISIGNQRIANEKTENNFFRSASSSLYGAERSYGGYTRIKS